jgi:hypothetical protein
MQPFLFKFISTNPLALKQKIINLHCRIMRFSINEKQISRPLFQAAIVTILTSSSSIFKLLLTEGRAGEAWEPSIKWYCFCPHIKVALTVSLLLSFFSLSLSVPVYWLAVITLSRHLNGTGSPSRGKVNTIPSLLSKLVHAHVADFIRNNSLQLSSQNSCFVNTWQ